MTVCAGVDGCRGGWIAVWRGDQLPVETRVFALFEQVVALLPDDAVIAVDIPVRLPDQITGPGRAAEQAVRKLLPAKASSVFSVPSRKAVLEGREFLNSHPYEQAYELTKMVARATSTPSKALSRQSFGILPKIAEVDKLLCEDNALSSRVWESHPEAAFFMQNGNVPLAYRKSMKEGALERRAVLAASGIDQVFLARPPLSGAKTDDFLDACALLLVAERIRDGKAISHPSPPDRDARGLPIAIWT